MSRRATRRADGKVLEDSRMPWAKDVLASRYGKTDTAMAAAMKEAKTEAHPCPTCGKEFSSHKSLTGHLRWCKSVENG